MEPDLRDGQRCCEKVSLWATAWGALQVVERRAVLGRENSLFPRHVSSHFYHHRKSALESEMRVLSIHILVKLELYSLLLHS